MKDLNNITLVIVDTLNYGGAYASLQKSLKQINPAKTLFFTDVDIVVDDCIQIIKIAKIKSKDDYSQFIIKELYKYIETDYVLVTQHDSWVLDGDAWDDRFYDYDYIGAAWLYVDGRNCGNGGFSLRSKKLQDILGKDEKISICTPEDEIIGRLYRTYLEKEYGIKYPNDDLCDRFSFELRTPIYNTFGFHSYFHKPFEKTVLIRRWAAMGDVIMVEPVLEWFCNKGYRVILDTLPSFHLLFQRHHYKVHRLEELDSRLLDTITHYNLDLAYEAKPKQLHLQSYYDFCGIKDGEIKNPKLSLGFPPTRENKPFKRYCILHIDDRPQPGRNIYGVDWSRVVKHIKNCGYDVIQLGRDKHEEVEGALYMQTTNESMLAYIAGCADLFVGIDSGISHICSGFDVPSVIFFGSVDPEIIHPDLSNKVVITNHSKEKPICDKPYCWHSVIGTEGTTCYIDEKKPPCVQFTTEQVVAGINEMILK